MTAVHPASPIDRIVAAGSDGPALLRVLAPTVAEAIESEALDAEADRQAELDRVFDLAGVHQNRHLARLLAEAKADRSVTPAAFTTTLFGALNPVTANSTADPLTPDVARRREQTRAIEAEARRDRALASLGIPARFADAILDALDLNGEGRADAVGLARGLCERWPSVPGVIVITGPEGSGKTHFAFALARALVDRHALNVQWAGYPALARTLKLAHKSRLSASRRSGYQRCDVLLVDGADLGLLDVRNPARGPLHLIRERLADGRSTIITSRAEKIGDLVGILDFQTARQVATSGGWIRLGSRAADTEPRATE